MNGTATHRPPGQQAHTQAQAKAACAALNQLCRPLAGTRRLSCEAHPHLTSAHSTKLVSWEAVQPAQPATHYLPSPSQLLLCSWPTQQPRLLLLIPLLRGSIPARFSIPVPCPRIPPHLPGWACTRMAPACATSSPASRGPPAPSPPRDSAAARSAAQTASAPPAASAGWRRPRWRLAPLARPPPGRPHQNWRAAALPAAAAQRRPLPHRRTLPAPPLPRPRRAGQRAVLGWAPARCAAGRRGCQSRQPDRAAAAAPLRRGRGKPGGCRRPAQMAAHLQARPVHIVVSGLRALHMSQSTALGAVAADRTPRYRCGLACRRNHNTMRTTAWHAYGTERHATQSCRQNCCYAAAIRCHSRPSPDSTPSSSGPLPASAPAGGG